MKPFRLDGVAANFFDFISSFFILTKVQVFSVQREFQCLPDSDDEKVTFSLLPSATFVFMSNKLPT